MGYAFFDKSGTFNPADHGLNVGDTINVVVVGGGGGGASPSYNGGTGASSSFGSYLTSAGGSPGVKAGSNRLTIGQFVGGTATTYSGGGGAGGYIPGSNEWGGCGTKGVYSTDDSDPIYIPLPQGSAGAGGVYTTKAKTIIIGSGGHHTSGLLGDGTTAYGGSPGIPVGGGAGYVSGGVGYGGGGGSGYGAGGGSGARNTAGYSPKAGNSGEVKRATIKLTNLNAIAVTIGSGGNGAGYSSTGTSGVVGKQPDAGSGGSGRGGYGDIAGGSGADGASAQGGAGGGGMGGCVEIFW